MRFTNNEKDVTPENLEAHKNVLNNLLEHKVDRKEIMMWNISITALICTLTFFITGVQNSVLKESINTQKETIKDLNTEIKDLNTEIKDLRKDSVIQNNKTDELEKQILLNKIKELES